MESRNMGRWVRPAIPLANAGVYVLLVAATVVAMHGDYPWLVLALWPCTAFCGHAVLLAFHEASHGTLSRHRWLNDLHGAMIGVFICIPLTVYRYVHGYHHSHLAQREDLQLWPFINPRVGRGMRLLAAAAELMIEFVYVPIVYAVGFFRGRKVSSRMRRQALVGYGLSVVVWGAMLTMIDRAGAWPEFAVGYLAPALLAGNLQTLRKFTEHMGLFGDTPETATRTIDDRSLWGRLLAESMLHVNLHAAHHVAARKPGHVLADEQLLAAPGSEGTPVYASYGRAFWAMLPSLANPRIGRQWLDEPAPGLREPAHAPPPPRSTTVRPTRTHRV
jgi:fatty acid desaturase